MSRRARRRQGKAAPRRGGRFWRAVAVAVAICALGVVAGYSWLKAYVRSDDFRRMLSATASETLGMRGEFGPFHWDGLSVDSDSFEATGGGPVAFLEAKRLRTEINLAAVRHGVWELQGVTVDRVGIRLDRRSRPAETVEPRQEAQSAKGGFFSRWLPTSVVVRDMDLRNVDIVAAMGEGEARASDLRVRLKYAGGREDYDGTVEGGVVRLPVSWLPPAEIADARFRWNGGVLYVSDTTRARVFRNGRLALAGEWSPGDKRFAFQGTVSGVKCEEFLSVDWAKRLTGEAESTLAFDSRSTGPAACGTLVITNGMLTALPVLDVLAAYADTRRFRTLALSEARTDWLWREGSLEFGQLVVASEGLVRLEGSLTVRDRQIDGHFRLGLAPGTLASIPGAETVVFRPGERGLLWAPLTVSGTLDDPREDLTARLTAAAEARMFEVVPETGQRVLKFTRSVLEDAKPVETGAKIIGESTDALLREGTGILREGTGILNGLLGGESPPPAPRQDSPPP